MLDALFPARCISCGKIDSGRILCGNCLKLLETESDRECRFCRLPSNLCDCRKILHIDGVFYKYLYIGVAKKAILKYKKENLYYINDFFAKEMFTLIEKSDKISIDNIDLISNVPRKGKAVRNFGYDQTKNLARRIARYSGIPYKSVLHVAGNYIDQKTLKYSERVLNVRNKFMPIKKSLIYGRNILLIDDVVTSGSTLSECARTLKNTGAKKVYALCVASSDFLYSSEGSDGNIDAGQTEEVKT